MIVKKDSGASYGLGTSLRANRAASLIWRNGAWGNHQDRVAPRPVLPPIGRCCGDEQEDQPSDLLRHVLSEHEEMAYARGTQKREQPLIPILDRETNEPVAEFCPHCPDFFDVTGG